MSASAMERNNVFDRLLKDRIVWLGSEVRDENANEICAKILLLAAEDAEKDIYFYINFTVVVYPNVKSITIVVCIFHCEAFLDLM